MVRRYTPYLAALALNASLVAVALQPASGHAAAAAMSRAQHATHAAKVIPGWPGTTAHYLGRYHLTMSGDPQIATTGELTIFMRVVKGQPKPVLSGILALHSKTSTAALYLTHFVHAGSAMWTSVNLGIYTGPILGKFKVTSFKNELLSVTLAQTNAAPITFQFTKYSNNPHP